MNESGIANLVLLAICAQIAFVAIFRAVPWMVKTGALYALHTLRDRLYAAAQRTPAIRETLIYRDVEFLLCSFLHICRDKTAKDVRLLASALHERPHRDVTPGSWRRTIYDTELDSIFAGSKGHAALIELFDISQRAKPVVLLRSLGENPLLLAACIVVAAVTGAFVTLAIAISKVFDARPDPADSITRDVEAVTGLMRPAAA
jgi:hypothetical protein